MIKDKQGQTWLNVYEKVFWAIDFKLGGWVTMHEMTGDVIVTQVKQPKSRILANYTYNNTAQSFEH